MNGKKEQVPLVLQSPPVSLNLDLPNGALFISGRSSVEVADILTLLLPYRNVKELLGKVNVEIEQE